MGWYAYFKLEVEREEQRRVERELAARTDATMGAMKRGEWQHG